PTALALFAHERLACAALLYGYLIDVDGATDVARAATQFFFATPPVTLDELPGDRPVLVVRAGRDDTPGLDLALQRFVAAAQARGLPVTVRDHPTAPHAFDLRDDSAETHAVIDDVLAFVADRLGAAHGS
ncbi:MAG: hypothetical protein KDB26_15485, partial [Microthrixaceae bacterium]|nr:hypothetical protein [Microthrixaceae bacterium]